MRCLLSSSPRPLPGPPKLPVATRLRALQTRVAELHRIVPTTQADYRQSLSAKPSLWPKQIAPPRSPCVEPDLAATFVRRTRQLARKDSHNAGIPPPIGTPLEDHPSRHGGVNRQRRCARVCQAPEAASHSSGAARALIVLQARSETRPRAWRCHSHSFPQTGTQLNLPSRLQV